MAIYKSNLDSNAYPVANPDEYLTGDIVGLDRVFAGRVAYVFKVISNKEGRLVKCHVTDGFRTHADQEKLYADYKAGKIHLADLPGMSWHEYSVAIDTSSQPIRNMSSLELQDIRS